MRRNGKFTQGISTLFCLEAHFEDGSVAENIDVVILATGYQYDFPFLEDGCVQFKAKSPILYKHTFPVEENPTLAFIGFPQVVGAIFAPSELQARLATRVFKGATKLPRVKDMEQDIKEEMERKEELYNPEKNITSVSNGIRGGHFAYKSWVSGPAFWGDVL